LTKTFHYTIPSLSFYKPFVTKAAAVRIKCQGIMAGSHALLQEFPAVISNEKIELFLLF